MLVYRRVSLRWWMEGAKLRTRSYGSIHIPQTSHGEYEVGFSTTWWYKLWKDIVGTYIYAHIYIYIHTHIYIYIYAHTHIYIYYIWPTIYIYDLAWSENLPRLMAIRSGKNDKSSESGEEVFGHNGKELLHPGLNYISPPRKINKWCLWPLFGTLINHCHGTNNFTSSSSVR